MPHPFDHRRRFRTTRLRTVGHIFEASTIAAILVVMAAMAATPPTACAQESQAPRIDVHEHVGVTAPHLTPSRETSGTSWVPQVTPMYGIHRPWRGWDIRLDGVAFVQGLHEPRDRHRTGGSGRRQLGSINWGMLMARRNAGWRSLRHPNDAQRGTVDRSRLRFIELSRSRRSLRRRHHSRPSTTTRSRHGAGR